MISMTSLSVLPTRAIGIPKNSAVFGLMYATLSQVTFESGFGSSCNQPLLANRPSSTCGSGRNTISMPTGSAAVGGGICAAVAGERAAAVDATGAVWPAGVAEAAAPVEPAAGFDAGAAAVVDAKLLVLATNPSCSACRQNVSTFAYGVPFA